METSRRPETSPLNGMEFERASSFESLSAAERILEGMATSDSSPLMDVMEL
jgi:hypothetical protein